MCVFMCIYIYVHMWVGMDAHGDIRKCALRLAWQALQYGEHVIDPTVSLGPTVSFTLCSGCEVGTIFVLSLYLR